MQKWYIVTLAALAVLLLLAGLVALILPDDYEGQEVYRIDRMHSIRMLDLAGGALLVVGGVVAWIAGAIWQRRTYDA